jgi:hypothetical protein
MRLPSSGIEGSDAGIAWETILAIAASGYKNRALNELPTNSSGPEKGHYSFLHLLLNEASGPHQVLRPVKGAAEIAAFAVIIINACIEISQ